MLPTSASKYKQQGVALITVMLIVATITVVAVAMSSEQTLLTRKVRTILSVDTALGYAKGGEHLAAFVLKQDFDQNQFDHLTEAWTEAVPIPVNDTILITGQLRDLSGRFNLSPDLFNAQGQISDPELSAILQRLFNNLSIGNGELNSLFDWVDGDVSERANGAEDTFYQTLERPYLAANRPLTELSELRQIKGFSESSNANNANNQASSHYDNLLPHMIVLPTNTKLNVNTASREVLQAFFDLDQNQSQQLFNDIQDTPFELLSDVRNHSSIQARQQLAQRQQNQNYAAVFDYVDVKTEYFQLDMTVSVGDIDTPVYSILRRNSDGSVNVISRVRGQS